MEQTTKSFFVKIILSNPLEIEQYQDIVEGLSNDLHRDAKAIANFSLAEDMEVWGADYVNQISGEYIAEELKSPTGDFYFEDTGIYDDLLKNFRKVIETYFQNANFNTRVLQVLITTDSVDENTNWVEIPNNP